MFFLDMDWEYPKSGEKTAFGSLMKQLRLTLGPSFLLSAALGVFEADLKYDLPATFASCDFVNVMTYDFNGWQRDGPVGHNAPLFSKSTDPADQLGNNVDSYMNKFVAMIGVVKSKIILGIPTYGKTFTLTTAANGVYAPGFPTGCEDYISICGKIKSVTYTSKLDNDRKAAYAFGGQRWVGYESPASAAIKAQYIKDKAFGGAMFWSLNAEDNADRCGAGRYPIISAVFNIINGGVSFFSMVAKQGLNLIISRRLH